MPTLRVPLLGNPRRNDAKLEPVFAASAGFGFAVGAAYTFSVPFGITFGLLSTAGQAVAYGAYQAEEREAREARRGVWASSFERPATWRARHPH